MPLGFDPSPYIQGAADASQSFQRSLVSGIETLGKQVRQDIQRIQATRELRAFGEEMVNVDPASPDFPQQLLGAAMRHPVALEDKRGIAAINMLGRQHEIAQGSKMRSGSDPNKPLVRSVAGGGIVSLRPNPDAPSGFDVTPIVKPQPSSSDRTNARLIRSDLEKRTSSAIDAAYKLDAEAAKLENAQDPRAKMARENATRKSQEAAQLKRELDSFTKATQNLLSPGDVENLTMDVTEVIPGAAEQPLAPLPVADPEVRRAEITGLAPVPPAPAVQESLPARVIGNLQKMFSSPETSKKRLIWNPQTGNFD